MRAVTFDHPQGEENKVIYGVRKPKLEPTQTDKAAGAQARADPNRQARFLTYEEAKPSPRRPAGKLIGKKASQEYFAELKAVQYCHGVVGQAAQTFALKGLYGDTVAASKRPPSAPSQMLVGKPAAPPPPTLEQLLAAPPPPPPQSARRPATASSVPSRHVPSRKALLRKSESKDFVRANARRVAANAETTQLVSARRRPAPEQSSWKLSRFEKASPRVFDPPKKAATTPRGGGESAQAPPPAAAPAAAAPAVEVQ